MERFHVPERCDPQTSGRLRHLLTGLIEPKVKVSNIPEGMELSDGCAKNLWILKALHKTYHH